MFKLIKTLVVCCCLVVSLSNIVRGEAEKDPEIGYVDLTAAFNQVNTYLTTKLSHSNDFGANLEALRELIAGGESKTSKLGALVEPVNYTLKVAKGLVHLMEIANEDAKDCNRETMGHLSNLFRAHVCQVSRAKRPRRLNVKGMERIDDLLNSKLEVILGLCEQYYDETYLQIWAKYNPQTRQIIDLISREVEGLDEIKDDHKIEIVSWLANKLDGFNYQTITGSGDLQAIDSYYNKFYAETIVKPCEMYIQQLGDLMEPVSGVDHQCKLLDIPLDSRTREFWLAQMRWTQCTLVVSQPPK